MTASTARSAAAQLADLIGIDALAEPGQLRDYAIGGLLPVAAVRPVDRQGLSAVLSWASRTGSAVYPAGGRTQTQLGNSPAKPGIAVDLRGLNRLVDFQPADLTITAEAGMTIADLHSTLSQEGKYVPIAAPLPSRATIGGTLAAGVSGPLRGSYGLPRDWLIGISVVDSGGTATNAGGKVVKNVTGYDLNRLYTGSLGTLAVITEATFKLAPAPSDWAVVVATFGDRDGAVSAAQKLEGQHYAPLGLHVLNRGAASRIGSLQTGAGAGYLAVALIGGRPSSVRRRVDGATALWRNNAASLDVHQGDDALRLMDELTDLPANPHASPTVSVRINSPPSALPDIMELSESGLFASPASGVAADVGFGGGRLLWWGDLSATDATHITGDLRRVQESVSALGGSSIVERCPESAKINLDVWGSPPSGISVMRRLKTEFDPLGILNPGRFIGGL